MRRAVIDERADMSGPTQGTRWRGSTAAQRSAIGW